MNLSFDVTHDELNELFSKYGEIEKIEIPLRKGGKGQTMGIAYINYKDTESAISCFASLDK
jgi:RNA recognition motif-containing protein